MASQSLFWENQAVQSALLHAHTIMRDLRPQGKFAERNECIKILRLMQDIERSMPKEDAYSHHVQTIVKSLQNIISVDPFAEMEIESRNVHSVNSSPIVSSTPSPYNDDVTTPSRDEFDSFASARIRAIDDTVVSNVESFLSFDEIAGLQEAKNAMIEALVDPINYPDYFKAGGLKPWKSVLLYGPPGTGKTILSEAVVKEINGMLYQISSSDLISAWQGQSEKLIKELFDHAFKQKQAVVIFIDEVDSLCRTRSRNEDDANRRVKTELLVQIQRLQTCQKNGNTTFAPGLSEHHLAEYTTGFSGDDLRRLTAELAYAQFRKFKTNGRTQKPPPPLDSQDVHQVLEMFQPSVDSQQLQLYEQFRNKRKTTQSEITSLSACSQATHVQEKDAVFIDVDWSSQTEEKINKWLEKKEQIKGFGFVINNSSIKVLNASNLKGIDHPIFLKNNPNLEILDFSQLSEGYELHVSGNPKLKTIFVPRKPSAMQFFISGNPAVDTKTLERLKIVTGKECGGVDFGMKCQEECNDLNGKKIMKCWVYKGDIKINKDSDLSVFQSDLGIKLVEGNVIVSRSQLKTLDALTSLEKINATQGLALDISSNSKLKKIVFPNLKKIISPAKVKIRIRKNSKKMTQAEADSLLQQLNIQQNEANIEIVSATTTSESPVTGNETNTSVSSTESTETSVSTSSRKDSTTSRSAKSTESSDEEDDYADADSETTGSMKATGKMVGVIAGAMGGLVLLGVAVFGVYFYATIRRRPKGTREKTSTDKKKEESTSRSNQRNKGSTDFKEKKEESTGPGSPPKLDTSNQDDFFKQ